MAFDWKKTLGTVAPMLATAFGGPLSGVATKVALDALGIDPKEGEAAVEAAIAGGDPSVLVKLKEADHTFKIKMKELNVDIKKLEAQNYAVDAGDRDNAREMAKLLGQAPQVILSSIFIIGFVGVLWMLFVDTSVIHTSMMQPAMYVLGILSAAIIQILNFWFGSSSGSMKKTNIMARSGSH